MPQLCLTEYFLGFVVFTYRLEYQRQSFSVPVHRSSRLAARNDKDMEFHLEGHKLIGPVRQLHAARSLLLHLIFSWQQKQDENNQPRKASASDWLLKNLQGILSSEG